LNVTAEQALRAYATMLNTLDASHLEPLLADDFHYASQWVLEEIESKAEYLAYMVPKLEAIRTSGNPVWAEMGWLTQRFPGPCVVVSQGDKNKLVGVVLAKVEGGGIKRLDLCGAPSPHAAHRTGEYPGREPGHGVEQGKSPPRKAIDLQYRPKTYFRPERLEKYLLSKVKGAVVRKKLKLLFEAGRHAELRELLEDPAFSERDRKVLESIHPMLMGGNYLPDAQDGEVEIARINIDSTTSDVTSVYAKPRRGTIRYRVVDEYDGDTLAGPATAKTTEPMTLGEFADFFLKAWSLIGVLRMNFPNDVERALDFFRAESDFYPDFDGLCRERVRERYAKAD
jgi:hypothetical protein